jgi:hypothetical protein
VAWDEERQTFVQFSYRLGGKQATWWSLGRKMTGTLLWKELESMLVNHLFDSDFARRTAPNNGEGLSLDGVGPCIWSLRLGSYAFGLYHTQWPAEWIPVRFGRVEQKVVWDWIDVPNNTPYMWIAVLIEISISVE